jgi:hypothetical protein
MTRLILAAGAAALAIAAPASAGPGGGHGGGGGNPNKGGGGAPAAAQPGGGGGHGHGGGGGGGGAAPAFNGGGGGGHGHGGGGGGAAPMSFGGGGGGGHGHGGGYAAPQMQQRVERQQAHQQARGFERQQARNVERQQARNVERQQARNVERQQARNVDRQQARGFERQQARNVERQQARNIERQNGQGFARQQERMAQRQQFQGNRAAQVGRQTFATQLTPQQFDRGNGKFGKFADRQALAALAAPYSTLAYANDVQILPVQQVQQFVGVPVAQVPSFVNLSPLPASMQYLYPSTPDYYYQYGNGYLYQVDQGSNLIAALIPLLAGGYLPGQYLPQSYMASYVPNYYGLNSFYPASYGPDYGYGYQNLCNRYANGVIYQVDCATGYVENVIPMYAGGYGVGQLLPSAYSYYNVPMQYRSMYYDTPNYGYWYAPGAIYQYDQRSSLITSVAALMTPGFSVGQALPLGYDAYNVPYDYRATYYDTPNAWYRYNNGYIYQVDPATQIVTAIVASLLT